MFINKIGLKNFKCFKNENFDFSKITIFTGANSSGKSSLLYSLLGALQTTQFPFFYSPNGDYVDMGDFREISFQHNKTNEVEIFMELAEAEKASSLVQAKYIDNRYDKMPRLTFLSFQSDAFDLQIKKNKKYLASYEFKAADQFFKFFSTEGIAAAFENLFDSIQRTVLDAKKTKKTHTFKFKELQKEIEEHESKGKFEFAKTKDFFSRISEIDNTATRLLFKQNIDLLTNSFQKINNRFNFISSFRLHPERTYYQKSETVHKIGKFGEHYIDQILEWESTKSREFEKLNSILRQLRLLDEIRTQRLSGGRFEILGSLAPKGIMSSLNDIGFGVSQLLPILVADLQLGKNSILMVSQPEIHLHPSVQAELADHFVKNMLEDNKRYLLETHSEYLLNRFRLLIAKGALNQEDIHIYYLRNEKNQSKSFKINFSKNGTIEGAPKDFFDTYMMDVMNIAMEAN